MTESTTKVEVGTYYCEECGSTWDANELMDGTCRKCGKKPRRVSEKSKADLWPEVRRVTPTRG